MRDGARGWNAGTAAALLLAATLAGAAAGPARAQDAVKTLRVVPKAGPLQGREVYANSHALLIGVSRYQHLPRAKWLRYADRDARELKAVLTASYGFLPENVTVLLNEDATKKGIEDALSAYSDDRRVRKEDRFLLFFSGHGQTVKLSSGGDMGFLVPYDAQVELDRPDNRGPYLRTCIRMDAIWGYLDASPARHSLLLADACYGGLLASKRAGQSLGTAALSALAAKRALQVVTAGGRDEEAFEDARQGHGAFTGKLLEELRARALSPGEVFTTAELYAVLQKSVANATEGKQNPQFGAYRTEGEFLFVALGEGSPGAPAARPGAAAAAEGRRLLEAGQHAAAEERYREALRLEPASALYHHQLGVALYRQQRYEQAAAAARLSLLHGPGAVTYELLGEALYSLKKYAEAETAFREALRLDPNNAGYHQGVGNMLTWQDRWAESVPFYQESIRLAPGNGRYHASLSSAFFQEGRYAEAEASAREAVRLEPALSRAHYWLGRALVGQKKHADAETALREAVRLDPGDAFYRNGLGDAFYSQAKYGEAEPEYRAALRLAPDRPLYHANLGYALLRQSRPAEAEASFREAIRLRPDSAGDHDALGDALYDQEKYGDAEAAYRRAAALAPTRAVYQADVARALYAQDRYADAEPFYRQAIALDAAAPVYRNGLGNSLFGLKRYADAAAAYREAIRLDGTRGVYWANLAGALLRDRKRDEARDAARRALDLNHRDHWVFKELGLK